ncbi:MAG: Gamma-glutamyltransferase, partial [uncultured bacterium]
APLIAIFGFVKGMGVMHEKWAKLKWQTLIQPSIELAANGFPLKGLIREKIEKYQKELSADPELKKTFVDPWLGKQKKIMQADLAHTLQLISHKGADVFYTGELAGTLLDFLKKEGSSLSSKDFKNYKVYSRIPFHFNKGPYEIYSASLPSTGGLALKSLFDCNSDAVPDENHLVDCLKKYFDEREKKWGDTTKNILGHTTHLNVVDQEGNMVAMTNTLNNNFGAKMMVPRTGIILNDELDDFSTNPQSPNFYKAGVRPLSSMTPTIIFKNKNPFLIMGTPGGKSIPQNIFQVLSDYLEHNKTLTQAIKKPKIYYVPEKAAVMVENRLNQKTKNNLKKHHELIEEDSIGNVQAIEIISLTKSRTVSDDRGEGKGFAGAPVGVPLQSY